ncbi:NAD(P) transhydrogenase subunit alpha [bacterium]|nr:NAD(P) transhydrogenase subunit alpha [bacterium]
MPALLLGAAGGAAASPFMVGLFIFVLACFVGYHVIWNVTPALHTPLMAVTNAISAIILVGCIHVLGSVHSPSEAKIIAFIGLVVASINVFGGFVVTQRMLSMYKKR